MQALGVRSLSNFNSTKSLSRRNPSRLNVGRVGGLSDGIEYGRRFYALPSHNKVGLPALSPTMETGNLSAWKKKEGEQIKAGDVIAEIETDKATVDFESTEDVYLAKILIPSGTKDIPVGKVICITVENEADIAAFKDYSEGGESASAPPKAEKSEPKETPKSEESKSDKQSGDKDKPREDQAGAKVDEVPDSQKPKAAKSEQSLPKAAPEPNLTGVPGAPPPPAKDVFAASPLARGTAAQRGVNVQDIKGSGPGGSSSSQEKGSAPTSSSGEAYTDLPNSQIRKVTAKRLTESKQQVPHYYLTIDCNVDKLLELRTKLNDKAKGEYKLSMNDFVVKAAGLALRKVPEVNSQWMGESIRRFSNIDINVAVNTDRGLLTPLVRDADKIGLATINKSVKEMADKAKANKLNLNDLAPGTFTVSNLGMFGIKHFTAVINPPQAAILAVGGTQKRLVPKETSLGTSESGEFSVANYMHVTLSCDHRVIDGATGAQWLNRFKEYMEDPLNMLL
eukprot:TRINITY_DN1024_c0_g1_i1.p1 TRINITY_DN1024_c0_g1~~TRINITY_DN1024_c0_g1_i1.p1  ORF type:complete len:508 (+),score=179.32 TRINITY_DN1024_c0_g1_i1:47-1570(+)